MYHLETIRRGDCVAGFRGHRAAKILEEYPTLRAVEIWRRGGNKKPSTRPGIAIYILATGGKWAKSSEIRIDEEDRRGADRAWQESRREKAMAPFRACQELQAELGLGRCFQLAYDEYRGAVMLYETLHDCCGRFGDAVRTPEAALDIIRRRRPQHDSVYHQHPVRGQSAAQPTKQEEEKL
jgi:hypothetical protein